MEQTSQEALTTTQTPTNLLQYDICTLVFPYRQMLVRFLISDRSRQQAFAFFRKGVKVFCEHSPFCKLSE